MRSRDRRMKDSRANDRLPYKDMTGDDAEASLLKIKTAEGTDSEAGRSNMLIFGDNLIGLRALISEMRAKRLKNADNSAGVRLIYIDPPFASGAKFSAIGRGHAYGDKRKGKAGFHRDTDGRWFKTAPRGDYTDKSIARLEKEGRIYRTRTGSIRIKYFLKEEGDCLIEEKLIGDVWDDIPDAMHMGSREKTGYPTQKPEALLRRIILASSGPGDIVLDAFAGSGTALLAAQREGRRWIGMDESPLAIETMEKRLIECAVGDFTLFHTAPEQD